MLNCQKKYALTANSKALNNRKQRTMILRESKESNPHNCTIYCLEAVHRPQQRVRGPTQSVTVSVTWGYRDLSSWTQSHLGWLVGHEWKGSWTERLSWRTACRSPSTFSWTRIYTLGGNIHKAEKRASRRRYAKTYLEFTQSWECS